MKFMKKKQQQMQEEHREVERKLEDHEERLTRQAKRLRRLEIEAGIYKPPIRRVS